MLRLETKSIFYCQGKALPTWLCWPSRAKEEEESLRARGSKGEGEGISGPRARHRGAWGHTSPLNVNAARRGGSEGRDTGWGAAAYWRLWLPLHEGGVVVAGGIRSGGIGGGQHVLHLWRRQVGTISRERRETFNLWFFRLIVTSKALCFVLCLLPEGTVSDLSVRKYST